MQNKYSLQYNIYTVLVAFVLYAIIYIKTVIRDNKLYDQIGDALIFVVRSSYTDHTLGSIVIEFQPRKRAQEITLYTFVCLT